MFSKLSGNSWCCFYSFWDSIVTRVCQHISGAPGKSVTTLQHHYQSQHLSGKENERHHSGGWNAAVALILLLSAGIWSNLPTINIRKQMRFFFLSSHAAERFLNAWSSSSHFPGSAVTQTLRSLTVYQGQHYFWQDKMLKFSRERRPSLSVAHLILKKVLYLKTGTKLYFSGGKAKQYCCFSLWSALMPSPVTHPIFPSVHPPW